MIFPRGGQFGASGTTTFCSKRHNQGVLILKAKDLERKVEKKKLQRVSNLRETFPLCSFLSQTAWQPQISVFRVIPCSFA